MKEIKFETIMEVLDNFAEKEKIADAAIEWRKALMGGRWDKAAELLSNLARITDAYWLPQELDQEKDTEGENET